MLTRRQRATDATTSTWGRARDLLMASQSRLRWPAGLTFPETAALGRGGGAAGGAAVAGGRTGDADGAG